MKWKQVISWIWKRWNMNIPYMRCIFQDLETEASSWLSFILSTFLGVFHEPTTVPGYFVCPSVGFPESFLDGSFLEWEGHSVEKQKKRF